MEIKNTEEIEAILKRFIAQSKDSFLMSKLQGVQANWKIYLTEDHMITQTAAISLAKNRETAEYSIFFNKFFLETHVENENQLVFVFLHEIMHKINGDLVREKKYSNFRIRDIMNVIFDIKINSYIIKNYLKEGYHFLRKFYFEKGKKSTSLLLWPVFSFEDLKDNKIYTDKTLQQKTHNVICRSLFKKPKDIKNKKALADWYVDAWFSECSVGQLLDRFFTIVDMKKCMDFYKLLGKHHKSYGPGGAEKEFNIDLEDEPAVDNVAKVLEAIRRAIQEDGDNEVAAKVITTGRGVVPYMGRREMFMMRRGMYPFFFPNSLERDSISLRNVNLYVDVSGSFEDQQALIYKIVERLKNEINDPVYLFSTKVIPVTISELVAGKVVTTMGTDFNAVAEHALENNFSKMLVVTDGMGRLSNVNIQNIKSRHMEVYLVLTEENINGENHNEATAWESVAKKIWNIDIK
ncbi:MAG: hypothetical protein WCJ46_06935 [bacterium]